MALTYNTDTLDLSSIGSKWLATESIDLDSSYPTGGYSIDAKKFGVGDIFTLQVVANNGGYIYFYDSVNKKLAVWTVTAGALAEVANGTDLSSITGLGIMVTGL